jgi:hypothetical protein
VPTKVELFANVNGLNLRNEDGKSDGGEIYMSKRIDIVNERQEQVVRIERELTFMFAPAAFRIASVDSMISGPMPSP